jgi:chromate transporter
MAERDDFARAEGERRGADGRPWPTFAQAIQVWGRVALLSFGGPAGQIAVMHRILVEEKRWLGEARFLHALNYCMLLPGPEAQQLTVYVGWLMHGLRGGLVAGLLFVLPGALAIMALSVIYALYGRLGTVEALFFGLKAAVLAIVLQAVVRIGRRALRGAAMRAVAAASFVAIFALGAPFPLIVLAAGVGGYLAARAGWTGFAEARHAAADAAVDDRATILGAEGASDPRPARGWTLRVGGAVLALWLAPTLLLWLTLGADQTFTRIALFFSQMAVLTFGGAYAVLAWVAQAAVEGYGWLQPGEMLDGLGMAETTPGPLIMVTQFVGFMAAFRDPGELTPLAAGVLGGVLTTWVTFAPCFLWIFLGAPHVERLRADRALSAALAMITAAVVGVILNLAAWFSLHVLFGAVGGIAAGPVDMPWPEWSSIDPAAALLSGAALAATFRFNVGAPTLLAGCAAAGLALRAVSGGL